ncbi:hypothetical protein KSP40_PGU003499 [Platanthera guangdongensis]|uniref:Uncharacterized protein n=1 Tax=Platanthera guangdongensis TaxID=2320717 RepID=A0ABR2LEA0_9ASPA
MPPLPLATPRHSLHASSPVNIAQPPNDLTCSRSRLSRSLPGSRLGLHLHNIKDHPASAAKPYVNWAASMAASLERGVPWEEFETKQANIFAGKIVIPHHRFCPDTSFHLHFQGLLLQTLLQKVHTMEQNAGVEKKHFSTQEALTDIEFPFKVRGLEDGDIPPHQIPQEDLEPPAARPRTSSGTARRMIGRAMGIEPGSSSNSSSGAAGSEEFRMQEAARKDRLHQRHDMKDSAWCPDS